MRELSGTSGACFSVLVHETVCSSLETWHAPRLKKSHVSISSRMVAEPVFVEVFDRRKMCWFRNVLLGKLLRLLSRRWDHSHSQLVLVLVAARDLLDYQVLSIRRRLENPDVQWRR